MGDDPQQDLAVEGEGSAAAERRPQVPLDHGEGGLDLAALAIELLGEVLLELPPVFALYGARPTPTCQASAWTCREDAVDAKFFTAEAVAPFALVAGVADQRVEGVALMGLADEDRELDGVRSGAAVHHRPSDHVAADVADG